MNPVNDHLTYQAMTARDYQGYTPEVTLEYRRDLGAAITLALASFAVGVAVGVLIITAILS